MINQERPKMNKAIRHGEIMLVPIKSKVSGKEHTTYIVGHSETGHHHVLESKKPFVISESDRQFVMELFEPAKLVHKKTVDQTITAENALNIRDADQRMAAIAMLRPDRLLDQVGAKLIHTGIKGTKLYEVKNFMGTKSTEYCMWMVDASTPREFIEWSPPEIGKQGDADLCQAHAFGIPLEDYLLIEQEG